MSQRAVQVVEGLVVVAAAEQRFPHLPLEARALERIPTLAERALVGGHRLLIVREGLRVRRQSSCLVADLEEVRLGLLPGLGPRVMVGEQAVELLEAMGEQRLDALRYLSM